MTDFLDLFLQTVIIGDPLLNGRLLFRAKTDMTNLAAGLVDSQNQDRMTLAALAFRATGLMANGPLKQRPPQQLGGGQIRSEFIASSQNFALFHSIK